MNESSSYAIGNFLDYARSRGAKKYPKDKRIFIYNMINEVTEGSDMRGIINESNVATWAMMSAWLELQLLLGMINQMDYEDVYRNAVKSGKAVINHSENYEYLKS